MGSILVNFGIIFHQKCGLGAPLCFQGAPGGGTPLQSGKRDKKSSKKVPKSDKEAINNAINLLVFFCTFCFPPAWFSAFPLHLFYAIVSIRCFSGPCQYRYIYIENADARPPHLVVILRLGCRVEMHFFDDLSQWGVVFF